ncbi:RagB/SusD family nutrient uptake outer membrane protein [Labilibaculum sp.]|uniref:RagB/SusD family nutrient uptake outer membrane protein n=1 Tax=Labilibaculum sp. TaxID=2060723 RepID=UPI003569A0B5
MNKIYIKIASILLLIVTCVSCADDYLETSPSNSYSEDVVLSTTTNAYYTLNGIHSLIYDRRDDDSQDEAGQSSNNLFCEFAADDVVLSSEGNGWWIYDSKWESHTLETSSLTDYVYDFYYDIIANANKILSVVDDLDGTESEINDIKGQCLTYRAYAHFMLVQFYGERYVNGADNSSRAVPLLKEYTTEGQPKATVAEIYTQVTSDLDDAITLLEGISQDHISNISQDIAKGIRARVALVMQDWSTAYEYAAEVKVNYSLMGEAEYKSGFNDIEGTEWIWGSEINEEQSRYYASFAAYISCNFNSTNVRTNPKLINNLLYDQISDTDYRKDLWLEDAESYSDSLIDNLGLRTSHSLVDYMNIKFQADDPTSTALAGDEVYMRVSEMYLIEAEALANAGQDANAAAVLYDLVSKRDSGYSLSTNTGQDLIDEILLQRRIELWGEGFRWLDLKRNDLAMDRQNSNHNIAVCGTLYEDAPSVNSDWQFLIPQTELDTNDNLENY